MLCGLVLSLLSGRVIAFRHHLDSQVVRVSHDATQELCDAINSAEPRNSDPTRCKCSSMRHQVYCFNGTEPVAGRKFNPAKVLTVCPAPYCAEKTTSDVGSSRVAAPIHAGHNGPCDAISLAEPRESDPTRCKCSSNWHQVYCFDGSEPIAGRKFDPAEVLFVCPAPYCADQKEVGVGFCDVRTTAFRSGDNYSVRSFTDKVPVIYQSGIIHLADYLNIAGHQYLQIDARDAHMNHCIYTMGLWGFANKVAIQSPDWGVAMISKKLETCLKEGSDLPHCVRKDYHLLSKPLIIEGEYGATPRIVAQGTGQYFGRLNQDQVALLDAIVSHQKPTKHNLFGMPIISMDISSQCTFSFTAFLPRLWDRSWYCNCMTFASRFRKDPLFLLEKVGLAAQAA